MTQSRLSIDRFNVQIKHAFDCKIYRWMFIAFGHGRPSLLAFFILAGSLSFLIKIFCWFSIVSIALAMRLRMPLFPFDLAACGRRSVARWIEELFRSFLRAFSAFFSTISRRIHSLNMLAIAGYRRYRYRYANTRSEMNWNVSSSSFFCTHNLLSIEAKLRGARSRARNQAIDDEYVGFQRIKCDRETAKCREKIDKIISHSIISHSDSSLWFPTLFALCRKFSVLLPFSFVQFIDFRVGFLSLSMRYRDM